MYNSSLGMDSGSLESIGDVLMSQSEAPSAVATGPGGTVVNPIDKLYSMQSSYFNAE